MFRSAENLRLAADMRALQRVAAPWRAARSTWFDGTPESLEARLAATERVLTVAKAGVTPAHMALEREAAAARAELREASHRLMVDFLDDGARAFKGSKRVAGTSRNAPGGMNERASERSRDNASREHFDRWYHGQPAENFQGAQGADMLDMYHDHAREHDPDYDQMFGDDAQRDALHDHLVNRFGSKRVAGKHDSDPDEPWKNQTTGEETTTEHWEKNLPPWDEDYEGKHRAGGLRVAAADEQYLKNSPMGGSAGVPLEPGQDYSGGDFKPYYPDDWDNMSADQEGPRRFDQRGLVNEEHPYHADEEGRLFGYDPVTQQHLKVSPMGGLEGTPEALGQQYTDYLPPRADRTKGGRDRSAFRYASGDNCEDQDCDDCGAESGEKCRPWCCGEAKNNEEKTARRTAAFLPDFDDQLLFDN